MNNPQNKKISSASLFSSTGFLLFLPFSQVLIRKNKDFTKRTLTVPKTWLNFTHLKKLTRTGV